MPDSLRTWDSGLLSPEGRTPGSERGGVWESRLLDPEELGLPLSALGIPDTRVKQVGLRPQGLPFPTPSCPLVAPTLLLHKPEDRPGLAVYFHFPNPFQPLGLPFAAHLGAL